MIFAQDTLCNEVCTKPFFEAIHMSVIMAINVTIYITAIVAITTTMVRKATTFLGATTITKVIKYIYIMIVTRAIIVIKNCNYYKSHNSHTFIKVMINTSLIRAIMAIIV